MFPVVLDPATIDDVLTFMQRIFSSPLVWFERLMVGSGLKSYWLACLFMFMVARFFLVPLFGRALGHELDSWVGSDKARKSLPGNDIDNDPYGGHI